MADKAEGSDLKSETKENVKDVKSDNAAEDSNEEDTKNGEKEDDESSEGEEHEGLYDKPVVIEGKRERKTTMFLANQTSPAVSHQPKPLLFEGKGESLGAMERTNYEIGKCTAVELKPLHKLLYGRDGRATEIKKNIRKFNGFAFEKDSKEYEAKKLGLDRFTNDGLKRLCEIFDLEKKGIRNDLLEKVMAFLMLPKSSGRPAPQPKVKKAEKKKRKRSKKDTEKSKKSKEKSKKTSETVESEDEEEDEEEEDEEKEEPPKKKKKTESTPKKSESSPKKAKETKAVKDKEKGKEKPKAKAKKTDDKKASKKKDPVPVKITPLKKASPKKKTPKKEKPAPVEELSSDEEPLAKKTKKQPPTNSQLEKIVKDLLDDADLEQVTMKSVCKQVYDMFPEHDLSSRKDFIKEAVRKVIS